MGKKLIVHSSLSCGTHVCGPHLQCLWHAALHMRGAGVRALLPCRSAAPDQSHACDPVPWRPPNARDECPTLARVWGRRDSDKRRCTMAQVRYSRDPAELERLATGVDHRQHWLFPARSLDTSLARCQPTEAQATGKSPRAEHPVMPGVSSVHPEVRRLLPHWQAFSIDERQVHARHTPNGNAPQLCLLPRI